MSQPFVLPGLGPPVTLDQSYELCERLATSHYENFSVGSWLLPKSARRHVYAMYAFSRFVDDLGDEAELPHRALYLYNLEQEVKRFYEGSPLHPMLLAVADTARRFQIPAEPFLKLIHANRMDQEKIRAFWSERVDQVALHGAWPFWDSYSAPLSDVSTPCGVYWERMYIWWDGTCNPCDIDYKSILALGKVDEKTTVKQIWQGPEAQHQRELHRVGRKNTLVPCNRCSGIV